MARTDLSLELERKPPRFELKKAEIDEPPRGSSSRSRPSDDHVTEIFKDSDLYVAAKDGNLDILKRALDGVSAAENASFDDILGRSTPAGNTFLHVAAKHGNEDIVTFTAEKKPSLVLSQNFNGETALHLAAQAGGEPMVRALVKIQQDLLPRNERDENNLLRAKNERGNTALHEAIFNGWDSIAEDLIKEDPELSYYENKDGESALYLAAKAGFKNCVSLILRSSTDQERVNELFKKKSPIQAAIQEKHKDVLEALFATKRSFIHLRDNQGRNPLHYAASLGRLEEGSSLYSQYHHNATQRDANGFLPIHLATIEGHVDVIGLLLQDCPDPGELLDRDGRNILHLAAKNGRSNVVNFVLKNPTLKDLINMKDKQGNTPLHLAAMCWHPMIVSALTWDKRVDVKFVNDKGMTALDAAEDRMPENRTNTQWLTSVALIAAGTPRSLYGNGAGPKETRSKEIFQEKANFRLLVSTLVATVTFAAGFTIPGGYNSSDSTSDPGIATLLRHKAFQVFVCSDIIAMYSSICVVVVLSWAQSADLTLVRNAVKFTHPFFWVSLTMMTMAFTAGVFLVVSKLRWLSIAVLVMGVTFEFLMFLYCFVIFIPVTSRSRVFRHISYYPFCLLVLVNSGWPTL